MAESKAKPGKKSIDDFADDLDAMLGETASGQQVGEIDDDDAIDRLLMGDAFEKDQAGGEDGDDIDRLLEQNGVYERKMATAQDAFAEDIDDLIAGFDLNPKQQAKTLPSDVDALPGARLTGEIDEFGDDDFAADSGFESVVADSKLDVAEKMTEIDEFADLPVGAVIPQDDFLLADFNISADDDVDLDRNKLESSVQAAPVVPEPADWPEENADWNVEQVDQTPDDEPVAVAADEFADDDVDFVLSPSTDSILASESPGAEPAIAGQAEELPLVATVDQAEAPPAAVVPTPQVDHSAELAALTGKLGGLKKLLEQARHDLETRATREELTACQESIDSLQTEAKKNKRNWEALTTKKPIGVYAANGIAVVAVMVAAGLWIDSFITKSQVGQLVEIVGQLKQQVESAPTADAAEKEVLRKQLDELTLQQTLLGNQLAELVKAVHGEGDGQKPTSDLSKQLSDLSNQDMQMGGAIEVLQNKVAALEKGKAAVAAAPKPQVKREPVSENWAVNLIAFKQDWYAKRKAEEFAAKGVPAKVSRTDSKGEAWYRLSVDGFPNQGEANSYAARVKKTLNLDSVWVARNKD